jgi:hypothetical protein
MFFFLKGWMLFNKCLFMKNLLFFTLLNKKIAPLCLKLKKKIIYLFIMDN